LDLPATVLDHFDSSVHLIKKRIRPSFPKNTRIACKTPFSLGKPRIIEHHRQTASFRENAHNLKSLF
jgi:hypothetical protein